MWGQARALTSAIASFRIIPTRVGTSEGREPKPSSKEDHPHACGDKSIDTPATFVVRGSSPRVWGQDRVIVPFSCSILIIPTRVGTSHIGNSKHIIRPDHPHACGDKTAPRMAYNADGESSPRVWGQDTIQQISQRLLGIIPTRVGTRQLYIDRNDKL